METLLVPPFYQGYVNLVKDYSLLQAMRMSRDATRQIIDNLPETLSEYSYSPGKWTIKELLTHMMDAERVFAYRALVFSRNDKTPLPGFDENQYVPESNAHSKTFPEIREAMYRLRESTIDLFSSFTPGMLIRTGFANNTEISVEALGYVIAGHEAHHCRILQERYLIST
jgi:uncharacterized damage-inducible protein DinB